MSNLETLQKEVFELLELSAMPEDERAMWIVFVPNMNEEELTKFHDLLKEEVDKLTAAYEKSV